MNEIKEYNTNVFESIKHLDKNGNEYWEARELMPILEYNKWENFHKVIKKSMVACETSNNSALDHFPEFRKMVEIGSKTKRETIDYKLSRYACYLIVQNSNPQKKSVALGQTYFAVQTRKQELTEEYFKSLDEDGRRLVVRGQTIDKNKLLYRAAKDSGVENYGKFTNYGYKGLYGGETASDIAKRKGLHNNEEILDYMGSEELADNLFRIVQTEAKLKKDKVNNEDDANDTHYEVGSVVRETIKKLGGTMPENLPTPEKSIQELELEKLKELQNQ
ncbi:MAG: DNA damage-inducible protein D [Firmicutes bacterium]|nr:DNA damage-inducible protein D [Bacillota bacterium]